MARAHPLKGPNRLKLGVFSTNADGGLAITDVPERWTASWHDNLTAAQIADRAELELFLPIARWKGFGGKNKVPRVELKALLTDLGFRNVRTYIQSGNAILQSELKAETIARKIEEAMPGRFTLDTSVIRVRAAGESAFTVTP